MSPTASWVDPARVFAESESCLQILRRNRFATIDVTNKPIESSAREVVLLLQQRLEDDG
jgi:regulator of PEP synthase PpsR (kinase-PPPase family)